MTVGELIAALQKLDKGLPVAFACHENNVLGYLPVENVEVLPAGFGQQVMLEPS